MAIRDALETGFSVANTDNLPMPQIPTPSRIANTPPALSLDERSFYTTKAWMYGRFSAYPRVLTQIINPWTYDPQWRQEERELIRDAEAMLRTAGQRVPVPGARPTPKPLPPDVQPLPGFEEPFFEEPTMSMRMVKKGAFIDLFGRTAEQDFSRPGALLETRLDLADDLTDDDFADTFKAAKDWNELLKEEGTIPWPGEPSWNPRLTATSKDPVVYLNWPERQMHVRAVSPERDFIPGDDPGVGGEAYAMPYVVAAAPIAIAAAAAMAAEGFLIAGLSLEIILFFYDFAGIDPPSEIETAADVMFILAGILAITTIVRLLPEVGTITATKLTWMGVLYSLGNGIAVWAFLKQDWVEIWELVDECEDDGGNRIVCTTEIIGKNIVTSHIRAGETIVKKVKEVGKDVAKEAVKSVAPLLLVGGAAIALVLFAKRKVGL